MAAAPGHVATVRHQVIDALSREQLAELATITEAILARIDPASLSVLRGRSSTS